MLKALFGSLTVPGAIKPVKPEGITIFDSF